MPTFFADERHMRYARDMLRAICRAMLMPRGVVKAIALRYRRYASYDIGVYGCQRIRWQPCHVVTRSARDARTARADCYVTGAAERATFIEERRGATRAVMLRRDMRARSTVTAPCRRLHCLRRHAVTPLLLFSPPCCATIAPASWLLVAAYAMPYAWPRCSAIVI